MNSTLEYDAYKPSDENAILKLFQLAFGGKVLPLAYWKWRFKDNPAGSGLIELAWDNEVLAGHYAVSPVPMSIKGEYCLTGLSGTTMTNPDYRGKGLFQRLARRTYDRMVAMDMPLVWGFPNYMIHRSRVLKLNWADIYEVPMFSLSVTDYVGNYQLTGNVSELSEVDERFDIFWENVKKDYDIIVQRNQEYLHWRYFMNPMVKYRLAVYLIDNDIKSYVIFKKYQNKLQIVDILVTQDSIDAVEGLMGFLIQESINVQANSINLWLNVTHPLHHVLEKIGFKPEGPIAYMGGLLLMPQLNSSIYDFRRWYFTMGDSDVF